MLYYTRLAYTILYTILTILAFSSAARVAGRPKSGRRSATRCQSSFTPVLDIIIMIIIITIIIRRRRIRIRIVMKSIHNNVTIIIEYE